MDRAGNLAKWFGNSKIVDEHGQPLIAYKAMQGTVPHVHPDSGMTHVALDPNVAKSFSGKDKPVHQVYIKSENPFDFRNPDHVNWISNEIKKNPYILKQFNKQTKQMMGPDYEHEADLGYLLHGIHAGAYQAYEVPVISNLIRNKGHDGIYMVEEGENYRAPNLAVFHPHQIKSVDNNGNFDSKNPDIKKGGGGEVSKDTAIHKGKKFWSGVFDAHDGFIREVHPYKKAEAADFHHSYYVSHHSQDAMKNGDAGFFWVDPDGSVNTHWRDGPAPQHIEDAIKSQIEPIHKEDGGGITAYHGSPHDFEQFDTSKIGSGEGNQSYGHGLYFAEHEPVAEGYRDRLGKTQETNGETIADQFVIQPHFYKDISEDELNENMEKAADYAKHKIFDQGKMKYVFEDGSMLIHDDDEVRAVQKHPGHMYEVHIDAHPDHFLDWDKPFDEQSQHVISSLFNSRKEIPELWKRVKDHINSSEPAGEIYQHIAAGHPLGYQGASDFLHRSGIQGIKFLDNQSSVSSEPKHNYVVFDHNRVNIKRKYEDGGAVEPKINNPMSVFPKPQRMFPEDAPVKGGQYLSMPDKTDMTGHKSAAASIGVRSGGKPYFTASRDAVDETGTPGRGSATAKTNLFKQKAGWKWKDAPEGHEDTNTIVSVEHRGKHHYALNAHFPKGVDLTRYEDAPSEPRLRPTTKGNVEFGPVAGTILVRGREHPVYHHVIVKNEGGSVEGHIPYGDKQRDKNLKDFHGKTPKEIKEARWYHGTGEDFSTFRTGVSNAIYLTKSPTFAQIFAKQNYDPNQEKTSSPNIMPVHVRAEKPFDYENKKHIGALYEELGSDLIRDPYLYKFMDEVREGHWGALESPPIQNAIKAMGHDSFYVNESGEKNLAVYNPSQIKSATGNNGNFDPNDSDITKSKGGEVDREKNLAKWNEGNALVDEHGQPLRLYRGAVGHKELPEDFLNGKTRGTYATFTSTNPYVAGTYAHPEHEFDPHSVGGVMAIHAHAHKLHEFPSKDGRFDMFAFDDFARRLPKGHAVVVRNVVDIGPRGSLKTDPEKKFSYPSDIYAWHEANSVKSAIGNNGHFDPSDPDITKDKGGDVEGIEMPHSLSELQNWNKAHHQRPDMNQVFTDRQSGFEGAPAMAMPSNLQELQAWEKLQNKAAGGPIAKSPARLHNTAIIKHALGKVAAPPPALNSALMVAKRGRPF